MVCDSIVSWAVLLVITIVWGCVMIKKVADAEEARKAAREREWEENGWG